MKNIYDKNFNDIITDFLTNDEMSDVIKSLNGMPWYFNSQANPNTKQKYDVNLNYTFLDTPNPVKDYSKLNDISQTIINRLNKRYDTKFYPHNAYLNCYSHGNEMQIHNDRQTKKEYNRTLIVYINSTDLWNVEWSGHTLLFDKDKKNIISTSIPFRNNAFLFDSELPHGIAPLSKSCYEKRIILVYQMEIE